MSRVPLSVGRDFSSVDTTELAALASAVVHAQEGRAPGGHIADWQAFETSVQVAQPLLHDLADLALLPVRRDAP